MELISFQDALGKTEGRRRYILLGNGFGIALFPEKFTYKSLLNQAEEAGLFAAYPELLEAFNILNTTDFEVVL